MRKIIATGLAMLALTAGGAFAKMPADILTATQLRDAIGGQSFTHRGISRSGDTAIAFAEGYVAAISATADWCDPGIAPHEILARVFDHASDEQVGSQPAQSAVIETLQQIAPCPKDEDAQ